MKFKIVHVTDHALERWTNRTNLQNNVLSILELLEKSRIIKKTEPLPYLITRQSGSVYSIYDDILFVMEPLSVEEFNLVTVITEDIVYKNKPFPNIESIFFKRRMKIDKTINRKNKNKQIKEEKFQKRELQEHKRLKKLS
jgi:hypothetical protein